MPVIAFWIWISTNSTFQFKGNLIRTPKAYILTKALYSFKPVDTKIDVNDLGQTLHVIDDSGFFMFLLLTLGEITQQ